MRYKQWLLMIRFVDFLLSLIGLLIAAPLLLLLSIAGLLETGSPIFRQERIGQYQRPFTLYKLRTMKVDTLSIATHLVDRSSVTAFGAILRRTKLDELPQLWNVLKGDMSLVGPRPCLPGQAELIAARASREVFGVKPGITGLAQIRGIDMSQPDLLSETDAQLVKTLTIGVYFKLLWLTLLGKGRGDRIRDD